MAARALSARSARAQMDLAGAAAWRIAAVPIDMNRSVAAVRRLPAACARPAFQAALPSLWQPAISSSNLALLAARFPIAAALPAGPAGAAAAAPPRATLQQRRRRGVPPPPHAAAAADAGSLSLPALSAEQRREQHPVLEGINDATKWAVSAAALATLLWRRDLVSAWCILGSVVAAANCRLLKLAINEARPSDRKADPGMPSAHGNSLGFLATFVSLAASVSLGTATPLGAALVLGVPSLAIYLAWLRVALGYHTLPQVVAGWLAGSGGAALWHAWGHRCVLPLLRHHPELQAQLYGATAAAVAFFTFQNVRRWVREAAAQRRQGGGAGGSA